MQLINGRKLAEQIRAQVKEEIAEQKLTPKLGVLLVGDNPASELYVNLKQKACAEVGIATDIRRVSAFTPGEELIEIIREWNNDASVNAILVQLPLPEGHDTDRIIATIDPKKDADGFHPANIAKLLDGQATILSPVHEGVLRLAASTGLDIKNAKAAVIANSDVFATPLVYLLKKAGARVTLMKPDELDRDACKDADLIVVAVGREKFLTRDLVKSGAIVIDVGTNKTKDGKTVGDADAKSLENLEGWLTPVPGGVGPMTIAMLLKNVVELTKK